MPHLCSKQFPVFESYNFESVTWNYYEIPFKQRKGGLPQFFLKIHERQINEWNARRPAETYMTAIETEESIERSRKRHRRREDDESVGSTNGRSVIHHIADDFVIQTVDQTVGYAHAHPEEFGLAPEQVDMLAKSVSVAEGEGELPLDHPLSMSTMTKLVQVMVSVLTDIQASKSES